MGKPVVSTDLSGVRDFNQEFGEVVEIAVDHAEFIKKVRAAIEEHDSSLASKRIAVAEGNSWDKKIEFISQKIDAALVDKSIEVKVSWQENLLNLYRHNRRRAAKIFLAGIFIYAVLFYTPLIWFLAEPLKISQPPQKADAIVVFAGGAGESGKAGQGYEEKVEYAVELYKKGLANNFIFSSGYSYHFKEPLIMQALAVSLGVPREAIILEEKANSTYTNVIFTKAILDQRGWKTILLVSSPYHMRRVALVMKRIAPELEVIFTPPPVSIFYRHGVTADGNKTFRQLKPAQLKALLHEYLGIIYYWLKGRV